MRLRNSFRILINSFGNVFKLLLFRLVTGILFFSIVFVIVEVGLRDIFNSEEASNVLALAGEFLQALISGNTEFLVGFHDVFTNAIADFLYLLGANMGSIVGAVIGVCVFYLVSRFLNGTASFAMGSILNDKMEAYSRTKFSSAYFRNLGKSVLHQVIHVPLTFIYDLLSLLACWFFFFYTPSFLPLGIFTFFIGLSLSMAGFICLQALKMTVLSAWIPCIVTGGEGVFSAFSLSFRNESSFGGRFSTYLIAIYLIFVLNVVFGLFTFGSMLFITVPASHILLLCIQLVFYYEDKDKKYFVSFRKISGADGKPDSMRD